MINIHFLMKYLKGGTMFLFSRNALANFCPSLRGLMCSLNMQMWKVQVAVLIVGTRLLRYIHLGFAGLMRRIDLCLCVSHDAFSLLDVHYIMGTCIHVREGCGKSAYTV